MTNGLAFGMLDAKRLYQCAMIAALAGLLTLLVLPGFATAHPLGNFTINHYTGIRVEPDRILLDVVIDHAEIPAFQAQRVLDLDGDGELSETETEAARADECERLRPSLTLTVDSAPRSLTLTEAGLAFPPGVGGLPTMRLVCGFRATLEAPLSAGTLVSYADRSSAGRLGWREIVVEGSGVVVAGTTGVLRTSSVSSRLSEYPTDLLTEALADTEVTFTALPGAPTLAAFDIPDAEPLPASGEMAGATSSPVVESPGLAPTETAALPGGVSAADLPAIFRTVDLTPLALLISIATAAMLGAGHALTPGHGKTLMAAYLVGTRGTPLHAAVLGLSVTLSHTLGILVLVALVVGAQGILAPDLVVTAAPILAAVSIVAIGGWMLIAESRRRWLARSEAAGGARHSDLPPSGSTVTWRSLFVLGLAGGLIPSTSALLILLGSIAAGRPAFGFVLVVAFGLGMALVLGGIGLALVVARGRLDRLDPASPLGRAGGYVPLVAAILVFGLGVLLAAQAVAGMTTR